MSLTENPKDSAKKFIRMFVAFMIGCGFIFALLSLIVYVLKD